MKKSKLMAFMLALVLILSACAGGNSNTKGTDGKEKAVDKKEEVTTKKDSGEKIKVVASFYPVADLFKKVGGDKVEVINLTQTGSAHGYEPTVDDMKKIIDSDLLAINGAGFESWVEKVTSANPDLKVVDLSAGVELIEGGGHDHDHDHEAEEAHDHEAEEDHDHEAEEAHDHDHEEGHDEHAGHNHGKYDPHIWLSFKNAKVMLENAYNKLVEVDPANKDYYKANFDENSKKLVELDEKYGKIFEQYKGKKFVVPHEAFGYLCKEYGVEQVGIDGINSDTEPNLTKMAEIIDAMKTNDVNTVFYEYGKSDKVAQAIASEINGKVKPISTIEVITDEDVAKGNDYFSLMEMNLNNIIDSFEEK